MTLNEYKSFMYDEYFIVCKEKSVLEIGPHEGIHTKLIAQHNPKYLELIEPFERTAEYCKLIVGVDKVIKNDVFFVIDHSHPMDIVICCGVLYHFHSPLHLLELIVNNCNPEYIILDCVENFENIEFLPEQDQLIANRQIVPNWRSAGFSLIIPFDIVEKALAKMGYTNIKKHQLGPDIDYKRKQNFWVGLWKRVE